MGHAIVGAIVGVVAGSCVAVGVFGAVPPWNPQEQSIAIACIAVGLITGTIAGSIRAATRYLDRTRKGCGTPKGYRLAGGGDSSLDFIATLASGRWATVALIVAEIFSALGCLALILFGLLGVFVGFAQGNIVVSLWSLLGTPVALILQFAMLVVFARAVEAKSE